MTIFKLLFPLFLITFLLGIAMIAFPSFAWSQGISYIPAYTIVGMAAPHPYLAMDIAIRGEISLVVALLLFIIIVASNPKNFSQAWRESSEDKFVLSAGQ